MENNENTVAVTNEGAVYVRADAKYANIKDTVESFVREALSSNSYVSLEEVKELAENCDIVLTRDVSFTVTVEFTCTANVGFDIDIDDLANELTFNATLDMESYDGVEDFCSDDADYSLTDVTED
jgi:hypothetical protein